MRYNMLIFDYVETEVTVEAESPSHAFELLRDGDIEHVQYGEQNAHDEAAPPTIEVDGMWYRKEQLPPCIRIV